METKQEDDIVARTNLILSSEVESLVADVQDNGALIIVQEFTIPAPGDGHIQLAIGSNLQPVLLLLPDLDEEFRPIVGIVGKKTKGGTWTTEKLSQTRPLWTGGTDTLLQFSWPSEREMGSRERKLEGSPLALLLKRRVPNLTAGTLSGAVRRT